MKREWNIRFLPNDVVILNKQDGTFPHVAIEGVSVRKSSDREVIYDVREIETNIGYPASQKHLRARTVADVRKANQERKERENAQTIEN